MATNLGFVAKLAALYPEWRRATRQVSAATNLGLVAKLAALHPESRRAMRQVSAATNRGFLANPAGLLSEWRRVMRQELVRQVATPKTRSNIRPLSKDFLQERTC